LYVILVIGTAEAFGMNGNEGATARIAAIYGATVLCVILGLTWGVFLKEPPTLKSEEQVGSPATAGFVQIHRAIPKLYRTNVALFWFYVAVALGGFRPLTSIALTFLTSQQQFTSLEVGVAALIMAALVIPGAIASSMLCRMVNPLRSSVLSLICMAAVNSMASVFLEQPDQKWQTFLVVACWGMVGGWKHASTQMLMAAIVPKGQDSELIGVYLFADMSLSWLPPLIFTSLNETGFSERLGLSSINAFFVLSLVAYWMMGSYEASVKTTNRLVNTTASIATTATPAEVLVSNTPEDDDKDATSSALAADESSPEPPVGHTSSVWATGESSPEPLIGDMAPEIECELLQQQPEMPSSDWSRRIDLVLCPIKVHHSRDDNLSL
jgi:MFS-type transporter involved in bile tolerance (Atg22 family)